MGKEIKSSEIIKLLDETIDFAQKALEGHIEMCHEQCIKEIEAQWKGTIKFNSADDLSSHFSLVGDDEIVHIGLLNLHIKALKTYRAKLIDEHNKLQMDYCLERQKNRLAIITATIGAIGVAIGAGITLMLKQ
ncbi:hypothetical protein [Helicobacter sp. 23-1045]